MRPTKRQRPQGAAGKLGTCCYCGSRNVFTFRGADRRELSCSNCGAPIRQLKPLKAAPAPPADPAPTRAPARRKVRRSDLKRQRKRGRKRPAESILWRRMRRFLDEMVDEIEDLFD